MTFQQTAPAPALETVGPEDEEYADAATVVFGTGSPALVVRPRDPDQVAAALTLARGRGLEVAVRSGGHGILRSGTNDGGLVIDLRHLAAVDVLDAERRVVRVGGGARWGEVAAALEPHGWALTSGDHAGVGVGGLTLGGGFGWMVRLHGLAVDNLVGARVVTADGDLVTASEEEHPDLFWALRGGGGNFGVVVDFDFVAQPVAVVNQGTAVYQLDDVPELLVRWRDAMRMAPDELTSTLTFLPSPPGAVPEAVVQFAHAGAGGVHEANRAIEPLLELGTVLRADILESPYAALLETEQPPPGLTFTARNTLVRSLNDEVVAAVDRMHRAGGPVPISLRSLGGAFSRVPSSATAFAHRDTEAMITCMVMLPGDAQEAAFEQFLGPWEAVAARGVGSYTNFQGVPDVTGGYPPVTLARLARVKRAFDPENVFAGGHNIRPAAVVPRQHTPARVG